MTMSDEKYEELVRAREVVTDAVLALERVLYPSASFVSAAALQATFRSVGPDPVTVKALGDLRSVGAVLGTRVYAEQGRRKRAAEQSAFEGKVANDFWSSKLPFGFLRPEPDEAEILAELRRIVKDNPGAFA